MKFDDVLSCLVALDSKFDRKQYFCQIYYEGISGFTILCQFILVGYYRGIRRIMQGIGIIVRLRKEKKDAGMQFL